MEPTERKMTNECWGCTHKKSVPGNCHIKCAKPAASMTGNEHGIKNGWFFYPSLFDPTWKTSVCNNFESVESVKHAVSGAVSSETSA